VDARAEGSADSRCAAPSSNRPGLYPCPTRFAYADGDSDRGTLSHAEQNPDWDEPGSYIDVNAHSDAGGHGYFDGQPHTYRDAVGYALGHSCPDHVANRDADAHADCSRCDGHAEHDAAAAAHVHPHAYPHIDADPNTYAYPHTHTQPNADDHSDQDAVPNPDA